MADRFSEGTRALRDQREKLSDSPAAPAGLQQWASGPAEPSRDRFSAGTAAMQQMRPADAVEAAQGWYTGANTQGEKNGWDNGFVESFVSGMTQAAEEGRAADYFRDGGTGVVTWDHDAEDGRTFRFGDVVEKGRTVGNVFDDFDRNTANLMMAPWVLDEDTQAHVFKDKDRLDLLDAEIERTHTDRNANYEDALGAMEFASDVEKRTKDFQEGSGDELTVLGAAAAGAGMGAVAGPWGMLAGAAVGGIGAWLNRDQLSKQAATAMEISHIADQEYGGAAGFTTGVAQWSGVAMKMISPFQNLTQGLYDDNRGNGESKFYATDMLGQRVAPRWMRVLDVGAAVGDGILQFASPIGAAMFTTSMAGNIGGQVTALATNKGGTFDFRSGSFDNIFTDDEGKLDKSAAAAGIAAIGIDAVQLGMARGLMGKTNAALGEVGEKAAYKATLGQKLGDRLPLWMGGSKGLAAGETRVREGGFSFTKNAEGKIVEKSGRATLGLLAPSEQLSALSARVIGMRQAARAGGAYTADDFYRAAHAMAVGDRRMTRALVNGFGEAYEEGVQAVLEPHSHGDSVTAEELLTSMAYGAAGGVGMSLGAGWKAPGADEKMFNIAQAAEFFETGGVSLTRERWNSLTEVEKRTLAAPRGLAKATMEAAYAKANADQAIEVNAGVAGASRLLDAVRSKLDSALAKASDRTDGAFVITQLEDVARVDDDGNLLPGSLPADAVAASAAQTAVNLNNHLRGVAIQLTTLQRTLADETAKAAEGDVDAAERVTTLEAQVKDTELTLEWGQRFLDAIDEPLRRIYDEADDLTALTANVEELNDLLRRAYAEQVDDYQGVLLTPVDKRALARAVSMVFTRDPQDQSGSYPVLVPQVSVKLTAEGTDNLLEISHAILPGISGDYDGDKIRPLNQLILDDNEFVSARSGAHLLGAGATVNVGTPKYEAYNIEQLAESLGPDASVTLQGLATRTLVKIGDAVRRRYTGTIDAGVLDDVLEAFYERVRAGDKDARSALIDGLALQAGGQITELGRSTLSNEWLWLDQLVVSNLQAFQEVYAARRPAIGPDPDVSMVEPLKMEASVRERRALRAATLGESLALFLKGDSLFRMFQKLHYTVLGAPVLSEQNEAPMTWVEQAMFYRELGQQVTATELERVQGVDEISSRVYVQLRRLAADAAKLDPRLSAMEALAVVANLRVLDLEFDDANPDKVTSSGHEISLAQMLLKRELKRDRINKDRIYDASPELQAKHARLRQMTRPNSRDYPRGAEQAFVEVVGAQQLFTLLGDDADIFGPHLTVEQFVRYYQSLSETERRTLTRKLQSEPAYLGKKQTRDMPYRLTEVLGPDGVEISAYRSVVDAITAVGNSRIAIDKDGKLTGELAERSTGVSATLRKAHEQIRTALFEFAGLDPRRDGELTVEMVTRMLEGNPDFARRVMDLIPKTAAPAVLQVKGDDVYAANWLYTFFTMGNPAEAEMHFWRNLLIAEVNALGISAEIEEADGDDDMRARAYDRLPRRMHRVLYELHPAVRGDNGLMMKKFISELESATDLDTFLRWVNTHPGIRGTRAPIVGWVDDVAEFDADKAQGGWTKSLAGSELREAISALKSASENLVKEIREERTSYDADTRTIAAVRRALKARAGDTSVQLEAGDTDTLARFEKVIELAAGRYTSLGPQAMLYQTAAAAMGFYPSAHTKGKNPPNVAMAGAFDAHRDAFGYVTNYERMLASLTTQNLDAVGANPSMVAKDAGRTMDDYGRPVAWTEPTVEQMLDLLSKPSTRPMARAVLFPHVMERTPSGQLMPQLLVGKSLRDLLNGASFKEMFPTGDRLSQKAAQRYVSFIEGLARKFNGHFAVQRHVNDVVIARTSGADHVLDLAEIEKMSVRAYHQTAEVLQAAASVLGDGDAAGRETLREVLDNVRSVQRRQRVARALGIPFDDEHLTDTVLDEFMLARETEALARVAELSGDPAAADAELAAFERFKARVELLRSNDMAGQVVEMFSITGDATEQAAKKGKLVEYVADHLQMLEQVSSLKLVLNKLTGQMLDPAYAGQPNLTDKEWEQLSRAVIAVYLDDAAHVTAPNVSVSPWPDADHARDERYFDASFTYLVEDLLDPDSPLLQAAVEAHRLAGRHASRPATKQELTSLLERTLLDPRELGPWTGDIPRASIEANQRLDSAAAEAAIAMAGNSPKRQAALIAATRRSYADPTEALLSQVSLGFLDLGRDVFDEVDATLPDGRVVSTPLVQLNNRYARSAVMRIPDAAGQVVEVDLLAEDPNLGRAGHPAAAETPYREIHLERLQAAVDKAARARGLNPTGAMVDVAFFHPDSQPDGEEFAHNLFFEGTSFKLDGDRFDSLLGTLWFSAGGINQASQRAALDASKLGVPALQVIETATSAQREALEQTWDTDFAGMLRGKAKLLIGKDLGFGELDPEFYNAVYKDLKLRHFVRTEAGLLTADQVIAAQARGEQVDGELWVPSDDVLRSLLGEQGTQGVARVFEGQLEIDPTTIRRFTRVTTENAQRFAPGLRGEVADLASTRVANRGRQSQLVVRTMLDQATRNQFDAQVAFWHDEQTRNWTDRAEAQRDGGLGFNVKANLRRAAERGKDMLNGENISLNWAGAGIAFIGMRRADNTTLSKAVLRDLAAVNAGQGSSTGWIYRENAAGDVTEAVLSQHSLGGDVRPAYRVTPGDLVVVEIDSFNGDLKLARKRIDYLVNHGAVVALAAADSQADLRAELAEYLLESNYEPIVGAQHAFQPIQFGSYYQNQRARSSTMTETRGISRRNRIAVFNVSGLGIQENAAWVRPGNERLGAIAVVANLVPTDFLAGFNVPVEQMTNASQVEAVRTHLRSDRTRALLREQANRKLDGDARTTADEEFDRDYDALLRRFDEHPGTVLPQPGDEFGTGHFIPLVDNNGRVLLYRHGYKAPSRHQVDRMAAEPPEGSTDAHNVAVFPSIREPLATVHTGIVHEFRPRAGYGLVVEMDVPLSVFGDKKQLEWNGMKYVLAPQPDSVVLPEHGFFQNWGVDLIASADDMLSKESLDGQVDNHRNAFAYFGVDFLPDVAKFFFPGRMGDPESQAKAQRDALELLQWVAARAERIPVGVADELIHSDRLASAFREVLPSFDVAGVPADWSDRLADTRSPEATITAAMLAYLMTPGAKVEDVLRSGGFNDTSTDLDAQSRLMPRLFTQVFDRAPFGSPLRTEMFNRFNAALHNPNNDGTGYRLHENWSFEIRNADPGKNMRGFLQFAEAHSSGDNPVKNGMSFDEGDRQQYSVHSADIAFGALGAQTGIKYDIAKAQAFFDAEGVHRFGDEQDGGLWRLFTGFPVEKDKSFQGWRAQTEGEAARRDLARESMVAFRQELDRSEEHGWDKSGNQSRKYDELRVAIVQRLGMVADQAPIVDFWIRQMIGRPKGVDENGVEQGWVSGAWAIQEAEEILWNVEHGYLPTTGAEVPMLHLHDLQAIFRANKNRATKWQPRQSLAGDSDPATTWKQWVEVSLGSALTSDNLFDPLYLLALDGFMHSYQNATGSLMDLPVSMDSLVAQKLVDPDLNQMLVSISDPVNRTAMDPVMVGIVEANLEQLIGGKRIAGRFVSKAAPADVVAKRRADRRRWRKENGVPVPVDVSMKNFRQNGVRFVDAATNTNALTRVLINLRVGTALINPALYASMGPEQWIRGMVDRMANIITGQSTVGATGKLHARVTQAADGKPIGDVLERAGLTARYTPEEMQQLGQLYKVLGLRNDFKGMLYRDLHFRRPHGDAMSRVERFFEGYAKFGSRMQDPTHGMKAHTMARRYIEGALQHINATPTLSPLSVQQLVDAMQPDPQWLKNNYPDAHEAGANALAQIRSLKETTLSRALKSVYEPLSETPNGALNMFSNVVLKLPLLFSGYATNVAVTILGLQGLDQMIAAGIHGRKKGPNSFYGRIQAKVRGEEFKPESDAVYDMGSVMEGIDLSRAFIRGGLTHAGLFAFGLMAGGLGLGGEDDEARKLRLLMEHQGLTTIYDPRQIQNDFRNSDALFLDNIPFLGAYFKATGGEDGRSLAQMHWMLKQFISPMMGMEKFFQTGDFRQVTWGFEDALGSFPLINTMMWGQTVDTANELASMAENEAALGGRENLIASAGFLTSAVGVYERMLVENSFVNSLYVGLDEWDRDPYVLPLRDSDGELQKDIQGNTRPNDLALTNFIDPATGKLRSGYQGRSGTDQQAHILTENRATAAVIASLFSGEGMDSDYWRYNMPIKTRTIEKRALTREQAEAAIRQLMTQSGDAQVRLTPDEIEYIAKGNAMRNHDWDSYNHLDQIVKHYAPLEPVEPLSVLDEHGREVITQAGAEGVFRGLSKGSVTLDAESLQGLYIPWEMRAKIQDKWAKELVQEGINLGLDQTKATSRMKRILGGSYADPTEKGLADILWAKPEEGGISYEPSVTYGQLNTTYVMGPDGRPWATGFKRDKLMGALGLAPLRGMHMPDGDSTGNDSRANTVDLVNGMNTGLRALVPFDDSRYVPTDVEIGKAIEKAIEEAAKGQYTPYQKFDDKDGGGSGWRNFGGGYRRYGGYGGGGGGGGGYFSKMYGLPDSVAPYGNSVSFINTSNPVLRRAFIRRERVSSERGRLNQWQ